jgi:hypothetical protein
MQYGTNEFGPAPARALFMRVYCKVHFCVAYAQASCKSHGSDTASDQLDLCWVLQVCHMALFHGAWASLVHVRELD